MSNTPPDYTAAATAHAATAADAALAAWRRADAAATALAAWRRAAAVDDDALAAWRRADAAATAHACAVVDAIDAAAAYAAAVESLS